MAEEIDHETTKGAHAMSREAETRNAKIESTFLGVEDHGMFVFTLFLDYGDGGAQGYQRILGKDASRLRDVLVVMGVESWELLPGKYCRVVSNSMRVYKLGHITQDRWTNEGDDAQPDAGNDG